MEHIQSLLDLGSEKTNFYCREENKPSPTHRISVIRHFRDPGDLSPTSEKGAEDDNDISSEGTDGYLFLPIVLGIFFRLKKDAYHPFP